MDEFEWIWKVDTYMHIVENVNEHFNILRRTKDIEVISDETYYLCMELLRIIPLKYETKKQKYIIKEDDGICDLNKNINFIIPEINKILQENWDTIMKIIRIRNKYEHEPHNIGAAISAGSGGFATITYSYKNEYITINSMLFTYIIYDINILMHKILEYILVIENSNKEKMCIITNDYIGKIKKRKNIGYNKTYVRLPRNMLVNNIDIKESINMIINDD